MTNIKIVSILCVALCGFTPTMSKSVGAPTPSASVSKSDGSTKTDGSAGKTPKNVQLLFVQNASGLKAGDGKLTLRGVEALTVCFSDRPMRLAGHMPTKNFVPMWSDGKDSFLKDPPNATLSILQGNDVTSAVVTLRNPQLSGDELTYDVTVLEGTLPESAGPCSLFIDIIGCPLTPMSYAGVARRTAWRSAYYGGGLNGPALYDNSGSYQGAYGDAQWSNGSGTATGWRGNTITWHRQ